MNITLQKQKCLAINNAKKLKKKVTSGHMNNVCLKFNIYNLYGTK